MTGQTPLLDLLQLVGKSPLPYHDDLAAHVHAAFPLPRLVTKVANMMMNGSSACTRRLWHGTEVGTSFSRGGSSIETLICNW